MHAPVYSRRHFELLGFAFCAAAVVTGSLFAMRLLPGTDRPSLVAHAATIDLAIVLPALYFWLLVRRRRWPAFSVVPVFAACLFVASRLVPAEHHALLTALEYAAIPVELALVGYIAWRTRATLREMRDRRDGGDGDFHDVARATLAKHLPPRIADIAASEISTLHYAFAAWRVKAPEGERYFSYHRTIGYVAIGIALIAVVTIEMFAGHFLIRLLSETAAWIVSGLTLYGVVWLVADLQAIRLRPTLVENDRLTIRVGTRWSVVVDRADIASIDRIRGNAPARSRDYLAAVPIGAPSVVLTFKHPVTVQGIYGLHRTVRRIGLAIDDPERFEQQLR